MDAARELVAVRVVGGPVEDRVVVGAGGGAEDAGAGLGIAVEVAVRTPGDVVAVVLRCFVLEDAGVVAFTLFQVVRDVVGVARRNVHGLHRLRVQLGDGFRPPGVCEGGVAGIRTVLVVHDEGLGGNNAVVAGRRKRIDAAGLDFIPGRSDAGERVVEGEFLQVVHFDFDELDLDQHLRVGDVHLVDEVLHAVDGFRRVVDRQAAAHLVVADGGAGRERNAAVDQVLLDAFIGEVAADDAAGEDFLVDREGLADELVERDVLGRDHDRVVFDAEVEVGGLADVADGIDQGDVFDHEVDRGVLGRLDGLISGRAAGDAVVVGIEIAFVFGFLVLVGEFVFVAELIDIVGRF